MDTYRRMMAWWAMQHHGWHIAAIAIGVALQVALMMHPGIEIIPTIFAGLISGYGIGPFIWRRFI